MKILEKQSRTRRRDNVLSRSTIENASYKFLKFIEDNEGSATQDNIRTSVLGFTRPGYFTTIFSDLVHNDLCYASSTNGYFITQKGINKLREVEARS